MPHAAGVSEIEWPASHPPDSPQRTAARSRWARLLARIYEVFPLLCPTVARRCYIEGRMEYDSFERNGVTIPTAEVVVREVVLLGSPSGRSAEVELEEEEVVV
jgi:hypothetical protein